MCSALMMVSRRLHGEYDETSPVVAIPGVLQAFTEVPDLR